MRKKVLVLFVLSLAITGCSQSMTEEEELRTVPVTNNPLLLPAGAQQQLPGMPMGTPR